jgi:hypothetical protein
VAGRDARAQILSDQMKTAKALGLTLPHALLASAAETIE